jgi:hypothetical protein
MKVNLRVIEQRRRAKDRIGKALKNGIDLFELEIKGCMVGDSNTRFFHCLVNSHRREIVLAI